jgi:hypothetical protein
LIGWHSEAEVWLGVDDPHVAFYDRCGNRIPMIRCTELNEDLSYHRVAWTEVGGVWHVSTIWLGLDTSLFGPEPLIFETMVFEIAESYDHGFTYHRSMLGGLQMRYATETEAREGHAAIVAAARQLFLPVPLAECSLEA